jgi:hypothetical protein
VTRVRIASHSSLDRYEKCSELHYREDILKIRPPRVEQNHFVLGTACHKSIETYLTDATISHPIDVLDSYWSEWLRERGVGYLMKQMHEAREAMAELHFRASDKCTDGTAIRKGGKFKGAEVWKNPVADVPQMTSAWKQAMEQLGIDELVEHVDGTLRALDNQIYGKFELSSAYSDSHTILKGYQDPDFLSDIDYIEFPISHREFGEDGKVQRIINSVKFPESGRLFNGYIDLVGTVKPELGGGVALLDHKSSMGPPPSVVAVAHHAQLLKYAWAWAELQFMKTGVRTWPRFIGINHLRSGTYVLAPVDPELAMWVVRRADQFIKMEEAGLHMPKDPFAYGSPCLKMSKDGTVESFCPHMSACHPIAAKMLHLVPTQLSEGFN